MRVLTAEEAASILRVNPDAVFELLESGRLRGAKIGDTGRTTERALHEFLREPYPGGQSETNGTAPGAADDDPLANVSLASVNWEEITPVPYIWPSGHEESHDHMVRAEIPLGDRSVTITIGFTNRKSAGMERRRANVFLGQADLRPMVEFAGANDFEQSSLLASVIKLPGGKHLRPDSPVPSPYQNVERGIYRDVVTGPYAAASVAVFAREDDHDTMAWHALIRASQKGLI